MATFAQLWAKIETLNERQRSELLDALDGYADHRRAMRRVINEIEDRITGRVKTNRDIRGVIEKAIESKHAEWMELSKISDYRAKRIEEHGAERKKLAASLRSARKRLREAERDAMTAERLAVVNRICRNHNMPEVPKPMRTAAEWAERTERLCGVYFGFQKGVVVYVGESVNFHGRMRSHHVVQPDWPVAFLETEFAERIFAELFYIWLLRPACNGEGRKFAACKRSVER